MRKLFVTLFVAALLPFSAFAQETENVVTPGDAVKASLEQALASDEEKESSSLFWFETIVRSNGTKEQLAWYERALGKTWGLYVLGSAGNDGYRSGLFGPYWKPTESLQIGIGLGRERTREDGGGVRRNLFISYEADGVVGFATFENGFTGPWHRAHLVKSVGNDWSLGLMSEKDLGLAPRAEYAFTKTASVWGAYFPSPRSGRPLLAVALDLTFD